MSNKPRKPIKIADGKAADAKRLCALCRDDPAAGRDLCRQALKDGSKAMRIAALECLPDLGEPGEAERVALSLVHGKSRPLRLAALWALRAARSDEALELLLDIVLTPTDTEELEVAHHALSLMPHRGATARLLAELESRRQALPRAGTKSAQQIDQVRQLLEALGDRPDKKSDIVTALMEFVRHPSAAVRATAMFALGQQGPATPEVLPVVFADLCDRNEDTAARAVDTLSRFPAKALQAALPAIIELCLDPTRRERTLTEALGLLSLQPEYVAEHLLPQLAPLLRQTRFPRVQHAVFRFLIGIGAQAKPLLAELLEWIRQPTTDTEPHLLFRLLEAVDPEGEQAIPALLNLVQNARPKFKVCPIYVLGMYGRKAARAVPALRPLLHSPSGDVKEAVEYALESIQEAK